MNIVAVLSRTTDHPLAALRVVITQSRQRGLERCLRGVSGQIRIVAARNQFPADVYT